MKSEELWQSYESYTAAVTANARKLAFAGAAVCWFFKNSEHQFPRAILTALLCIVIFFVADLLQFVVASALLRVWIRRQERAHWKEAGTIKGDFPKPWWLDRPAYALWWVKVVALLAAFFFIGAHLL